jgi:hypothetical protein
VSDKTAIFELKEKAKWSHDPEERKTAIKELSIHGKNAIPSLQEISNVTAYEEIKMACLEAIQAVGAKEAESRGGSGVATSSATVTSTDTNHQKKAKENEKEKEEVSVAESEFRLADLPP